MNSPTRTPPPTPIDPPRSTQILAAACVLSLPALGMFYVFYIDSSAASWADLHRRFFDVAFVDLFDLGWIKVG